MVTNRHVPETVCLLVSIAGDHRQNDAIAVILFVDFLEEQNAGLDWPWYDPLSSSYEKN